MKTKILSITAALFLYANGYSQVGINTMTPTSTLDVTAKNATGTTTNVDGLLIPRVDRERAQSMASIPTSTMIYVNSFATGTQTGTAANIDAVGYYYYNGTIWDKLNTSSGSNTNIYNSDGSLNGNRVVTQAANTLAFTGTAVNAFSVDGSTFSVDAANKRIGIGTTSPANKLHLGNDVGSSVTDVLGKKLAVYNNAGGTDFYGLGINAATLQFHAASTATAAPGMVLKGGGNVGIGTTSPTSRLEISSGTSGISGLKFTNMNSSSTPTANAAGLAVDTNGNVVVQNVVQKAMVKGVISTTSVAANNSPSVGPFTQLSYSESLDVGNNFAVNVFTAPRTGYYMVDANIIISPSIDWNLSTNELYLDAQVNGTTTLANSTVFSVATNASNWGPTVSINGLVQMNAGQQLTIRAWMNNNNIARTIQTGRTSLSIVEL
ncbi:hypothetical protein [Chryseobacterium sp. SIMBA_038]|uniref:hypothetical protein n=1 Tax=Chryseobacterium sp. SIMBA_038 TaxID=3085780 RepID=UPI00397B2BA4